MKKVVVIAGAGPAGLTAAYEFLTRTDIHPIVCETSDALGGIAQTYNYKGNRIDIGGHRFFSKSGRVMDWWFEMLPCQGRPDPDPELTDEVMLQRPRLSRIFYHRSFFPYPLVITVRIAHRLGWINTFLIGLSYIKAHMFPLCDETYLDVFLINRFGRRLYETFFKEYTEKVWGVPCNHIKADWGAQRIKGLSLKRALTHALKDIFSSDFQKVQEQRETSLITQFYYPKYGPGQMWEVVAKKIQEMSGEVRMRTKVSQVKIARSQVVSVTVEDSDTGKTEKIECDYFFSTMPIKHLMRMIHPSPPPDVLRISDGLVYRDFITVGLLLKRLKVKDGKKLQATIPDNWIYVQEGDVNVGRIQIFNNWSPYMVKDAQNTVWIGLEYFVDEGDAIWSLSDKEMIELGTQELEKIGFIGSDDVLDGCVLRMPKTYPAYFGTYDEIDKIRDWTLKIPNMFLVGRNGLHRYNNQDHSMLTAMTAVDNIKEERTDNRNIWEVNAERIYHEEKH